MLIRLWIINEHERVYSNQHNPLHSCDHKRGIQLACRSINEAKINSIYLALENHQDKAKNWSKVQLVDYVQDVDLEVCFATKVWL